jgi:NADH-quinone oxidoreductase subunit N
LKGIYEFVRNIPLLTDPLLLIGMGLLIVGFGFKVASVPFHMWTPDVYEGAPTSITAFMSVGPKAAGFAAFLRVFLYALSSLQTDWVWILWVLAVLTMTLGNVVAIAQKNIKRMLAYSSIAHAGYILVAMVAASELGTASVLYYILAYAFMNLGAFGVVILYGRKGEENIQVSDYSGMASKYPLLAAAMAIFMFSLAGIPPTAGFVGKFYIFSAAVKAGYIGLAIIGVLNSALSVYFYLRVTVMMYMRNPEKEFARLDMSPAMVIALIIAVLGTLQMGITPSQYLDLARQSILALM